MRYAIIACILLISAAVPARAQISVSFGSPTFQIGINMPVFPQLVRVPGYPVYYDPQADGNYFFYDGLYWVYAEDNWYESDWYNGPWREVAPEYVPLFVLRVPVRYYRRPPPYFEGWVANSPPRWGEHWGRSWEEHHNGWDRWDRRSAPAAAPLPSYQRRYSEAQYPRTEEQQRSIRQQSYHYAPREQVTRQHFQQAAGRNATTQQPDHERQSGAQQQERTQQQHVQQQQVQQQQEHARQSGAQQQERTQQQHVQQQQQQVQQQQEHARQSGAQQQERTQQQHVQQQQQQAQQQAQQQQHVQQHQERSQQQQAQHQQAQPQPERARQAPPQQPEKGRDNKDSKEGDHHGP